MGKCLGERALNKEAARGIYGLQIRYSPVWTVNLLQPRLQLFQHRNISSIPFLSSEPMVMHITLYTLVIITTISHKLNH